MRKAKKQQIAQEKGELEKDINLVRETPYTEEEQEQIVKEVSSLAPKLLLIAGPVCGQKSAPTVTII